ncbi:SH3 domain-containing protein [Arenibaculum pallidiluteum]|uniref:SH3 domain-containing protein n=1 Tax=Arenibaculum pallidiluteum TaxID=2812559 RepID=UPI001A960974|nr:SH3 domain-containing protein [Arenibaculum pallidiluteum]
MRRVPLLALLLVAACQSTGTPGAPPVQTGASLQSSALDPVGGEWESLARANLRSGPGTEHAVLGKVFPGDRLRVLGRVPGSEWLAVTRGTETAYIRQDLARAVVPMQSAAAPAMSAPSVSLALQPAPTASASIPAPAPTPTPAPASFAPVQRPAVQRTPAAGTAQFALAQPAAGGQRATGRPVPLYPR